MADFDVKFCPHCGEEIDYVANTCSGCGEELPEGASFCPSCGEEVDDSWIYCNECGKEITEEDVEKYKYIINGMIDGVSGLDGRLFMFQGEDFVGKSTTHLLPIGCGKDGAYYFVTPKQYNGYDRENSISKWWSCKCMHWRTYIRKLLCCFFTIFHTCTADWRLVFE